MNAITRPPVRWHGGKFLMSRQIIPYLPAHRLYTEAFGGGAGVLLHKDRSHAEIYNDLDDDIVGLFRVLQDPAQDCRLIELLRLTPFARREFEIAYDRSDDPIERARRLVIRSFMGFGSNAHSATQRGHQSTGFRSNSNRSGTTPAQDWQNLPAAYGAIIERMRGVVIEHRDALIVLKRHDAPTSLHYVDPPYVHDTRSMFKGGKSAYRHELDRGGACQPAGDAPQPDRHGGAIRLRPPALRRKPARLAAHRIRRARRWRAPAHRGALDQSGGSGRARSRQGQLSHADGRGR